MFSFGTQKLKVRLSTLTNAFLYFIIIENRYEVGTYSYKFLECFEPNINYPHNDIIQEPRDSVMECLDFCRQTAGCNVFTWHKTGKYCWLKTKRGRPVVDNNLISGPTCGKI